MRTVVENTLYQKISRHGLKLDSDNTADGKVEYYIKCGERRIPREEELTSVIKKCVEQVKSSSARKVKKELRRKWCGIAEHHVKAALKECYP